MTKKIVLDAHSSAILDEYKENLAFFNDKSKSLVGRLKDALAADKAF